ncbi:hypothetical protein D3C87_1312560 [compost metagenome]
MVFIAAAGAGQAEAGALGKARALVRQQRRIGGQADHDRAHARMRQRGPEKRRVDLFHVAPDRVAIDTQFVADAMVGLDDGADGPAALGTVQSPRGGADAALELMADHAAATADIALRHRAAPGTAHSFGDVLGFHMKAVDVVEQAVIRFQHHRHVPVEPAVSGLLLAVHGDQRIAHHAQAVGVGEGNRAGQQTRFTNPLQPRGVAIAIEHMDSGETRLLAGGTRTRFDDGDAGQDVATFVGTTSHIAVADPNAGHVGDGIERAGLQLAKLDVEVAGTWFHRISRLQIHGIKRCVFGGGSRRG